MLAGSVATDLALHLVADALENAVSSFDGFAREVCLKKGADLHFQNIVAARQRVQAKFGFDFADTLASHEWDFACRVFQKRHLLAHKMGVIDEEYVRKAADPGAIVGRKVQITHDEVNSALGIVEALGRRLYGGLLLPTSES